MPPKLTPYEAVLFYALKARKGGVITYEELQKIEPPILPPAPNLHNKFAVHMRSLRRKLGANIKSVRGVGYKIEK